MVGRSVTRMLAGIAAAVAVVTIAPTPAQASPVVECDYSFSTWPGGYWAAIQVTNHGPELNGWTVYWELADPAQLDVLWDASYNQLSPTEITATNLSYNSVIPSNGAVTFGWTATTGTTTHAPVELTINGVDC